METEQTGGTRADATADAGPRPDWWQRDHPTFTALAGFFAGLAFVIVIPGAYAALLRVFVDNETAEELFPLVLVTLAIPLGLAFAPRTRRFGRFMLLGIGTTAVVVLGSAALVLWFLYRSDT